MKKELSADFVIQFGCLAAYQGHETEVIVPDTVSVIGRRAFYCSNIRSVILPETVVEVESEAFLYSKLEKLEIQGRLRKVGRDAFPFRKSIFSGLCAKTSVEAFSKATQPDICWHLIEEWYSDIAFDKETLQQNVRFFGKHMLLACGQKTLLCDLLARRPEVLHRLIDEKAIPKKDVDLLIEHFRSGTHTDVIAALMQYKQDVGDSEKPGKEKNSFELTVADWHKIYKFKYVNGAVEITGCTEQDDEIAVPAKIGNKEVTIIGRKAFDGHFLPDKESFDKELSQKRSIVLPNGITEIRRNAFYCVNNRDIYIPETVTHLPSGMMVAVEHIILHIPAAVTEIENGEPLVWDSPCAILIKAPAGSYAETYAKENNIPFKAE